MNDEKYFFDEILPSPIMKSTIKNMFGEAPFDVIVRPASFVILLNDEPQEEVRRILVLRPHGFSANSAGELSSHPEAREATIEIKGAVRPGRVGYFPVHDCVEFRHHTEAGISTSGIYPYADAENAWSIIRTSRTRFKVVKAGGYGFYHNLINLSDEWLVLILDKKLNQLKKIDYSMLDSMASKEDRDLLLRFRDMVISQGDGIFGMKDKTLEDVTRMDPKASLPVLISFLNVPEEGRHEQCSVFATILKISKSNPKIALDALQRASKNEDAPPYYLRELIGKVSKYAHK